MLRRVVTFPSINSNKRLRKSGDLFSSANLGLTVLSGWVGRPYASNNNAAAEEEAEAEAEVVTPNPIGRKFPGKRLPKAERRAMLESFVNKYRAMNGGPFPTASYAQKQLGGSYYVVKSILQELRHTAKMSPSCPAMEDLPPQQQVSETPFLGQIDGSSTSETTADAAAQNGFVATSDTNLPGQEQVREVEAWTRVENNSTSAKSDFGSICDAHLPGQDELRDIQLLTEVEKNTTGEMSPDASAQSGAIEMHLEAKEDSLTFSSVEILSEEAMTTESDSDLVPTQSNMLKGDSRVSSHKELDKVGNGIEEAKQNLFDSISKVCQLSDERFEVVWHPCHESEKSEVVLHPSDESEKSEREEAQADKHDFFGKEKDLSIEETKRASPSFGDLGDIQKQEHASGDVPNFDGSNSECKTEPYEEIPQPDKLSKDISGRRTDDAEPSTIWGNIKSLANSVISIFRKL